MCTPIVGVHMACSMLGMACSPCTPFQRGVQRLHAVFIRRADGRAHALWACRYQAPKLGGVKYTKSTIRNHLSGARTAVFDRWSDRHCPTKAPAAVLDRPVRSVPGTGRTGPAGTGRTNLSDQLALASVGQCPSDHGSNTAVRAPLELPCSTG
ncbi:hypothetical protein PCANC_28686 [Puccinia coronata f. sp. avenae]|uniref:Uncharacterized protein n=1 Tax=Puccinia coronata f. sp. avenae TaxID=200324 RepID=A0A2N5TBF2_9BASI|nr:hypothetical protein PCANC_28686 [Puccinia coronata f. sp. avenae]